MYSGGRGSAMRKEFFDDDGKKGAKQTPHAKCKLCSKSYARPNYGDQGLQSHMEKAHKEELAMFLKKLDDRQEQQRQSLLSALKPAPKDALQHQKRPRGGDVSDFDNTVLCFAKNLWSFRCFETEEFQIAFAASIPSNVTRQDLAKRTTELHQEKLKETMTKFSESDVTLMFDAATIHNRRFLNFCIADQSGVAFYRSLRVGSLDTAAAKLAISNVISELADSRVFVFALVADNAPAFHLAMQQISNGESEADVIGDSDCESGKEDTCADAPEHDADLTAALQQKVSGGIFGIRCAAHSLQLVLKDIRDKVEFVQRAEVCVDRLMALYSGSPEKEEKLRALQKADGCDTTLLLVKPVVTRWNSKVGAFWRALKLKVHIASDGACNLTDADWADIRMAVVLCEKVAVATDKVQADTSTVYTSLQCVAEVREHFKNLLRAPEMKYAAEVGMRVLDARADKHFFSDLHRCAQFLHPATDNLALSEEDREAVIELLLKHASAWCARRGSPFRATQFQIQLGKYVATRAGGVGATAQCMAEFWGTKQAVWPDLGAFGVAISSVLCTEASVERSFSALGRTFASLRSRMTDSRLESQLFLHINCTSKATRSTPENAAAKKAKKEADLEEVTRRHVLAHGAQDPSASGFVIVRE